MATYTVTQTVNAAGTQYTKNKSYDAEGQIVQVINVPASRTDYQVNMTLDVSTIKVLYLSSTQAVTIETNSASSPAETLSLVENGSYVFTHDGIGTNAFATDITSLWITNGTSNAATVTIAILHDPTPAAS